MARILIVDDDPSLADLLRRTFERRGHVPTVAHTLHEGYARAQAEGFDVVFLDVRMPDGSGLDMLPQLRATEAGPEVIVITGEGDPDGAELAINAGAWDYVQKGESVESMVVPLERALRYRDTRRRRDPGGALAREDIVGQSPAIRACLDLAAQAAGTDAGVLITGETGTGKELFAHAIHANSARAEGPFIVVDCAAMPETLAEETLFGHERGAYTGADQTRQGLVGAAHHGTLFLDEIGELPLRLQTRFLRVLQEKCYRPIGSNTEIASDFRVVAATNRDLDAMVATGDFREELLYRVRAHTLALPPVRERTGDIWMIAAGHIGALARQQGLPEKACTSDFRDALEQYPWPGNVRELLHAVEYAFTAAQHDERIAAIHLPRLIRAKLARASVTTETGRAAVDPGPPAAEPHSFPPLKVVRDRAIDEAERAYLRDLWRHTGGNVQEACTIAGLSRSRLYALLQKHGLS